jgi:hypothetical protein
MRSFVPNAVRDLILMRKILRSAQDDLLSKPDLSRSLSRASAGVEMTHLWDTTLAGKDRLHGCQINAPGFSHALTHDRV